MDRLGMMHKQGYLDMVCHRKQGKSCKLQITFTSFARKWPYPLPPSLARTWVP